jgi:uncharacterized protein YndB with AHSA1/START domain
MAKIRIVRDYPYPPVTVWRAVTDPELVARWTVTGQGGRPVGFTPIVGSRFQLVAKPVPGWRGIVDCEVLEVDEPRVLRYTWRGEENGKPTFVSYHIEPRPGGTRFTFEHTPASLVSVAPSWPSSSARFGGRCSMSASQLYSTTSPKAHRMRKRAARADRANQ